MRRTVNSSIGCKVKPSQVKFVGAKATMEGRMRNIGTNIDEEVTDRGAGERKAPGQSIGVGKRGSEGARGGRAPPSISQGDRESDSLRFYSFDFINLWRN